MSLRQTQMLSADASASDAVVIRCDAAEMHSMQKDREKFICQIDWRVARKG